MRAIAAVLALAAGIQEKPLNPIQDDPNLPRVLLIGDSISIGYTIPVRKLLAGKVNVHRPPENCGPTPTGLKQLDKWLGTGKWDVIHFNWGLHDLKHADPSGKLVDPSKGKRQVEIGEYEKNLDELVRRLKKTGAKLIWGSTTPVPEGSSGRIKGDEVSYNAVAEKVMKAHGVAIDDLHGFAAQRLEKIQQPRNVHFTPEGSGELARQVSDSIQSALGRK